MNGTQLNQVLRTHFRPAAQPFAGCRCCPHVALQLACLMRQSFLPLPGTHGDNPSETHFHGCISRLFKRKCHVYCSVFLNPSIYVKLYEVAVFLNAFLINALNIILLTHL